MYGFPPHQLKGVTDSDGRSRARGLGSFQTGSYELFDHKGQLFSVIREQQALKEHLTNKTFEDFVD